MDELENLTAEERAELLEVRKQFPFYRSYKDVFTDLSNEESGTLLMALLEYQFSGIVPDFEQNRILSVCFKAMRGGLDAATDNYINQVIQNRKHGKLGGRPRKTNLVNLETNLNHDEPQRTNLNPKEKKGKDKVCEGKVCLDEQAASSTPKNDHQKSSPPKVESEEVKIYFPIPKVNKAFNEFLKARKDLKVKNTNRAVSLLVDKLNPFPPEAQYESITESIMNGWKGVFPKNGEKSGKGIEQTPFVDFIEDEE
ncbi:DUF6291 domain-containing protein [Eubacterium aggregans]|uniref:DUF6291 domain-containing protein n=1 Tax=Eubacterium aggregans TaxID=81409 RepID=UPI003F2CD280